MRVGIAADHAGFRLKIELARLLTHAGHDIVDFGNRELVPDDDYPRFVVPMARAVARAEVERGVAVCGSGVGASVAANKIPGIRAALVHDVFSAHQGVEDDAMNILCLGGHVIGDRLALELALTFLEARFRRAARHQRRLAQVARLEQEAHAP